MKNIFLAIVLLSCPFIHAQVPKKVVVEHFTNSKCSICASLNPGFYTNLNKQKDVIHLAIHPSSPYSACVLSQHNVVENDGRTNYYGVYGSTPRLVIQGVVIASNANYSSSAIFTPYLNQTSPASIRIVQTKFGKDSIRSRIVIKTEASHSLGALSLFVALAEDTLNYKGSNGEPVHYDVFRKSLSGFSGMNVTLPTKVGDSLVYTLSSPSNAAWNFAHIFTLAILQEKNSKAVVQSQSVPASSNSVITSLPDASLTEYSIHVFSTQEGILVNQDQFAENLSVTIYDATGKIVFSKPLSINHEVISLPMQSAGMYLYSVQSKERVLKVGKVMLQ